ncbi:acyl-CoA dehydrogenase family protein [Streptomonospora nanhaiensis]|uniref:Alkylation response protein AidB-like acyl-CoA dehydrogenase n=1 Tax=Streptomonospora nanhaiensis TaxID=1323731 RepID=A0A853BLN2_9ACTN|nr:acyl-CoA dehydrogenase family protein [Streptomonospora nanhaiensis]MBV2363267.1 acyl-CoA dehydrogenase family protein [Streptomonospora nanhaiensis]MBX9390511.1 acyl-CoA dehydrogenase family protein [Streptomonospora nanhaiensis]NYI95625.1 alkylation response protein AidB-like acyl-CoA dehydrogenase [Streptomonospora nanhaiensis]
MTTAPAGASLDAPALRRRVAALVETHDPATTDQREFLAARFDAGLAWVHFPEGEGGLGAPRSLQAVVDQEFERLGFVPTGREGLVIGLGMAAPTILAFGTPEQRARYLKPLYTGEEVWCQLFSEPGAGSDLAALGTRAVRDGDTWVVNGQKVWTSLAHRAHFAILVTRTDPDVPKHKGMTYFICDMSADGVEVRPLRQLTGEAEFNEVYLTDVRIPDSQRLGAEGEGWRVAQTTLMNERVAIGGHPEPREGGLIAVAAHIWRTRPELRTPGLHDALLRLWVEAEAARLTKERLRQQLAVGQPGPEGSAAKFAFSRLNQEISGLELELLGEEGMLYDDWTFRRPEGVSLAARSPGFHYLRSKGNSIEGGTSEILRNIIAERVLGLPGEIRVDKDVAWKDLPK